MPNFEYDYNDADYQLVANQIEGELTSTDYVRLVVYENNNIVNIPETSNKAIFYASLSDTLFNINISPFNQNLSEIREYTIGGDKNDFNLYLDASSSIYVKPNEIFNAKGLSEGNYKLQIDFLRQVKPTDDTHYGFIVKEISTSRKEVRLKLIDKDIDATTNDGSILISKITNEFNTDIEENITNKYQFRHVLNIGDGKHIPITNYYFDKLTDGKTKQSIILRLYEPLSPIINNLTQVTIEREVLITQTTDVYYFSDVKAEFPGSGLSPDNIENWLNTNQNESFEYENYNILTSSLSNTSIEKIVSGSVYDYPNLNTNFNLFENHTFFGSAKLKILNFKNKVGTIQGYYGSISASLSSSGVSLDADSNALIQHRKNLFDKINSEINSFTPYEKFLYYDGQSESTASAPGLGKNYTNIVPVNAEEYSSTYQGKINGGDGFDVVYYGSSKNIGPDKQSINLFNDKYRVEDKPFFNHSGSFYLSFLMKSSDGVKLNFNNSNDHDSPNYARFPKDSMNRTTILAPIITGSHYQRFIFEASQSFWIPSSLANDDFAEIDDFSVGSNQIHILSGSTTGSKLIRDSSGKYQNYTTVVTGSGALFNGSCMPAGELFNINELTNLSQSLQGYWNIDDVTSGSGLVDANVVNDAGPTFGDGAVNKQVSASSGVSSRGRTYGSSYFMVSESGADTGVHFDSTNYNFNKEDNFSMAIWAKRFHPNTGSADATSGNTLGLFSRGQTTDSYGIDYNMSANKVRVGVRPDSSAVLAEHIMSDDLLNWHHIAFTYESGSSTGIKLYIDGALKDTATTIGVTDFSASNANADNNTKLTIGGNDIIAGTANNWNGFIQYPRVYSRTITQNDVSQLYHSPDSIIETKITDIKISLRNPTDVLPFDNVYHTSSANWTNWYNGMYDSASNFDTDNIHSLQNNLPLYIQDSNEYDELKDFLALQGEQYDTIRNHIDSLGTINDRGYKKTDSPPENTYPMLLNNMGWESINPFSGSLTDTLGNYLTDITSIDDIKNNTWRKTLNNLLYVYKTKGTQNSVRGLLNIYGYPPDVLQLQEFGGSTDSAIQNSPGFIKDSPPKPSQLLDTNLENETGSISFTTKKQKLYRYMPQTDTAKKLNLDWWMDSANLNTIEFVYKHNTSTSTQMILESSGSGAEKFWDLRLVPSTDGISSSFEFRLNNSNSGSLVITDNAVSMSTPYSKMANGQLWNIMLQRMSSSISGSGTNEYRLHSAIQSGPKIELYNYVTMSISGGLTADSNHFANQNWVVTGSRHADSSSNLFVAGDGTFSGSLAEIKGWSTALSTSRFRQHIFNKFSIVGNSITSHCKELVYHFKLNENYTSSSISSSTQTPYIIDSSPKINLSTDYSFSILPEIITGSILYGVDKIDVLKFGLQDNNQDNTNDNNIIINPRKQIIGNLNSKQSIIGSEGKSSFVNSPKLELNSSPQDTINSLILDSMDTFNFEKYYGNPKYYYSSSYTELDDLRKDFFNCFPIEVNINQYIRAHENIFNQSLASGLKTLAPARSTLSDAKANIGVTIKQNLLEKQKYDHKRATLEINPNTATGSINPIPSLSSSFDIPITGSISMGNTYVTKSIDNGYITPNFLHANGYTASLETEKIGSTSPVPSLSSSFEAPITGSIGMGNAYVTKSINNGYITPNFLQSNGFTASVYFPPSASIEEITTQYTKEFVNIHDSWGTGDNDTHFINYAGGTGSNGDYNVAHIDGRNTFQLIGDIEYYSGSNVTGKQNNFTNIGNFYNRRQVTNVHGHDTTTLGHHLSTQDLSSHIKYETLIPTSALAVLQRSLVLNGRMMGKTRYFFTGSDGTITLPSNHVSRYVDPYIDNMRKGTQNTNPGIMTSGKYEDYSSASFYRVKVTGGENQIIVKSPNTKIDSDNNIIY